MKRPPSSTSSRRPARRFLLTLLPACTLLSACTWGGGHREIIAGPTYPRTAPLGETLDIQVFRHQTQIEFTNTTARDFGPSTIWLNRRFSRSIDGLAVGQTLTFPLSDFRDRFGDPFRAGGFFALDRPERLAVAELATNHEEGPVVLGLIVVGSGL